jgi:basic amino acid/polyamine antiporter, APA family
VAGYSNRNALTSNPSPLALVFTDATGHSGAVIKTMTIVAMVNGLLVQIVMASRVLYGMGTEALAPRFLSVLHATRKTPVSATLLTGLAIIALGCTVPIGNLAEYASGVVLLVYALVNISLVVIGGRAGVSQRLARWRWIGVPGAISALGLIAANI